MLGVSPTPEIIGSMLSRNVLFSPGIINVDFSMFKNTHIPVGKEGLNLQFRAEAFNLFNHTNFGGPVTNIASSQFGVVSSTQVLGRQVQLGLKLIF